MMLTLSLVKKSSLPTAFFMLLFFMAENRFREYDGLKVIAKSIIDINLAKNRLQFSVAIYCFYVKLIV